MVNKAVMSRGDTDDGHDQTKLLLQPYLLRMQHLSQPLADGAKSKQSKTKLFHVFPFAMMVSNHSNFGCLGNEPALDVTSDGRPYTKFSLAVDQGKEKQGKHKHPL